MTTARSRHGTGALGPPTRPVRGALGMATALALTLSACAAPPRERELAVTGGDPDAGRVAFLEYGCASCHASDDVPSVRAGVGPDLDNLEDRLSLAGQLPNRPEELIRWIRHPQQIAPGSLMPDLGVTEQDARDITAFLYGE